MRRSYFERFTLGGEVCIIFLAETWGGGGRHFEFLLFKLTWLQDRDKLLDLFLSCLGYFGIVFLCSWCHVIEFLVPYLFSELDG